MTWMLYYCLEAWLIPGLTWHRTHPSSLYLHISFHSWREVKCIYPLWYICIITFTSDKTFLIHEFIDTGRFKNALKQIDLYTGGHSSAHTLGFIPGFYQHQIPKPMSFFEVEWRIYALVILPLLQIMAFRLVGAQPLSEPILIIVNWNLMTQTAVIF